MLPEFIYIDPVPTRIGEIPIKSVGLGLFPSIEIKISLSTSEEDIQCYALVPGEKHDHKKTKRKKEKRS